MNYVKYGMIGLVALYTVPAIVMSAFAGEAARGPARLSDMLLIWSPHLLLMMAFAITAVAPEWKYAKTIFLLPLFSFVIWGVFLSVVQYKNSQGRSDALESNRQANAQYLALFPSGSMTLKPENYIVRKITDTPSAKIFAVAVDYPPSELQDIFGNRTNVGFPESMQMWLYIQKDGKTQILDTGRLQGVYLNSYNFSNVGYYEGKTLDPSNSAIRLNRVQGGGLDVDLNVSTLPMVNVDAGGTSTDISFSDLKKVLTMRNPKFVILNIKTEHFGAPGDPVKTASENASLAAGQIFTVESGRFQVRHTYLVTNVTENSIELKPDNEKSAAVLVHIRKQGDKQGYTIPGPRKGIWTETLQVGQEMILMQPSISDAGVSWTLTIGE